MLRKLCLIGLCAIVLASGCRKKEEEPTIPEKPPKEPPQTRVQVPEGFARIGEKLFMTRRPPRIEEYVKFLEATGQDLPERLQTPDVNYQDPITGLAREQAEQFATWKMLHLPSPEEWESAEQIVGSVPYPWDGKPAPDAPLYLVRDWTEDSQQQKQARQARQNLMKDLLENRRSEVEMGRKMLANLVESKSDQLQKQWEEFKSTLSELVEQQKQHARQVAQTEGRQVVLQVLKRVGQEKKKVVHAKFAQDAPPEALPAAKKAYEQFLEKQRNDVQELKEKVVAANQKLSEQARGLMQQLEKIGQNPGSRLQQVAEQPETPLDQIQDMQELARMRRGLQAAISEVKARAAEIKGSLQAATQKVTQQMGGLQQEIEALPEEKKTSEEIQTLQENIQDLNENLEEQFVQEPHLFKELNEYADLAATKRALEKEVATLEKMVALLQQPAQPAETPAEDPAPPAEEPEEPEGTIEAPEEETEAPLQ
jgi:hypothetical protein